MRQEQDPYIFINQIKRFFIIMLEDIIGTGTKLCANRTLAFQLPNEYYSNSPKD